VLARDADEADEGEEPATADAEVLCCFLEAKVLPWFQTRKKELANRPLIREQAYGEALDPDKLERLGRYEVYLDRYGRAGRTPLRPRCRAGSLFVSVHGRLCSNGGFALKAAEERDRSSSPCPVARWQEM